MNMRKSLLIAAALAALSAPAISFAEYWHPTSDDRGYVEHPEHWTGTKTRQEVKKELEAFRRAPLGADGQYRLVGGDVGWEAVPHSYALRGGRAVHVDGFRHDTPRPSLAMTPQEKAEKQRQRLLDAGG